MIEAEELRRLLQEYNGGRPLKDDELRFVSAVADINHEDCLSADEALYVLGVWFAFKNMPKSVGAAMTRYGVAGGTMPSLHTLEEFLTTLNDSQPIRREEVLDV